MTSPSADRDLLMFCVSRSLVPVAPFTRSLPARSTNDKVLHRECSVDPPRMWSCKRAWDLEECSFAAVEAVVLSLSMAWIRNPHWAHKNDILDVPGRLHGPDFTTSYDWVAVTVHFDVQAATLR